jgi:hypothetical protein
MSCSATCASDASELIMFEGFVTKSVAPAASAVKVAFASCALAAVNTMIGRRSPRRRSALTVSTPSIKGISRSIVMRSGASSSTIVSAIRPSAAVPITSICGSPPQSIRDDLARHGGVIDHQNTNPRHMSSNIGDQAYPRSPDI